MSSAAESIKSRILIPVLISILVMLSAFLTGIYWLQTREMESQTREKMESGNKSLDAIQNLKQKTPGERSLANGGAIKSSCRCENRMSYERTIF
jgi:hypothetical protein